MRVAPLRVMGRVSRWGTWRGRGRRLAAGLPPAQDEIGLLGVKVGGQGVGVSGHLAGQELRFPFRQNLHGARGGVPDVVAVGLLGVSGL